MRTEEKFGWKAQLEKERPLVSRFRMRILRTNDDSHT